MENIITLKNVTKVFKSATALNNVSAEFAKGQIHGIVGRNGSGKTVMMKCICGLMHQSSGEIVVKGKSVPQDEDMPRGIGAIIEAPGFLPNYSGFRNLKFLGDISRRAGKAEIIRAMETVGLDPGSKKHVGKYSLGMRQRLGLAQAIMEDPEILILDEPMNGLDKSGVEEMRELLLSFKNRGKTILLASHSSGDIEILCDTVHETEGGIITKIR